MATLPLAITKFVGGMANDEKEGIPFSAARVEALEFRKRSTSMTHKPKPRQVANQSIVTDLIVGGCRVANGDEYFIGDNGRFYKVTIATGWSLVGQIGAGSAKGLLYREDADAIYLTSINTVSRYWPVSGNPIAATLQEGWLGPVVDSTRTGGAATYALPSGIDESATGKISWQPACSPMYSVKLKVVAKGTSANWTVTLHDDANTTLATKTVNNASLANGALNEFVFSSLISQYVKPNARTYHIHISASDLTGTPTAQVTTASDFSTADYETYAQRLEAPHNQLHPIGQVAQYTLIGNGRYVAVHEPLTNTPDKLEFLSHKLVLPPGYEVTGFGQYGEQTAISAEKRTTDSTARLQDGKIFLWDPTTAGTYSTYIMVPSGSPFTPFTADGLLLYVVNGKLKAYAGAQPATLHDFPGTNVEFTKESVYTVNYPYTATMRDEVTLVGFPSETSSTNAEFGVYSYGTINKDHSPSFGIDFHISTGTRFYTAQNNLRIGMVLTLGDSTYVSWRDDSQAVGERYGMDVVDNFSDPAPFATWESLKFDANFIPKPKKADGMCVTFEALPAGATVTAKYKLDRADDWTYSETITSTSNDPTIVTIRFGNKWKECEFGFDSTATTVTPRITSVNWIYDDLREEKKIF